MNKKGTILVVDDEPANIKIIAQTLRDDYHLLVAKNGMEALQILERQRVDLILLDLVMPGMSGFEVCERIKKNPLTRDLDVIFVTGRSEEEDVERGLALGAFYYVTKPFDQKLLQTLVASSFSQRHLEKKLRTEMLRTQDSICLLSEGEFRFRTLDDVYNLSVLLANTCFNSEEVVVGLKELLTNAVEHGNLELDYEDKSRLYMEDGWEAEVNYRLNDPNYADRYGTVRFLRKRDEVQFLITDQGSGFDWEPYLDLDPTRMLDSHGRGILIASKTCFDRVEYQGVGNRVLAVIKIKDVQNNVEARHAAAIS
ncbi:response regulator [Magnetococcales bacterium HHB-1]